MAIDIANARSFLFVPATRPERFSKALESGADWVVIDLEDAVAAADKDRARENLADGFSGLSAVQRARVLVRINPTDSEFHDADLALLAVLVEEGLRAVMVPKAAVAAEIQRIADRLSEDIEVVALVESLAGVDALDYLAKLPSVVRFAFGHLDFQVDMGMNCDADEEALIPVRFAIAAASRRANMAPPIDGVTVDTKDLSLIQRHIDRALGFGFAGKLCIHPAQVGTVNRAFTPSRSDIEWAQRVVAADAHGGAVFSLDGKMVDMPVISKARHILAKAQSFEEA